MPNAVHFPHRANIAKNHNRIGKQHENRKKSPGKAYENLHKG
jgi:hypothetical protein